MKMGGEPPRMGNPPDDYGNKYMNINVISCLNKLFSIKGIINNIGFYFL